MSLQRAELKSACPIDVLYDEVQSQIDDYEHYLELGLPLALYLEARRLPPARFEALKKLFRVHVHAPGAAAVRKAAEADSARLAS
jgi:hypothetical protein